MTQTDLYQRLTKDRNGAINIFSENNWQVGCDEEWRKYRRDNTTKHSKVKPSNRPVKRRSRLHRLGYSFLMAIQSLTLIPPMIIWSLGLGMVQVGAWCIGKCQKPLMTVNTPPRNYVFLCLVSSILLPFANVIEFGRALLFLDE